MDGIGNINWWGFSPSIDFLEHFQNKKLQNSSLNDEDEIKILLVSAGDQRHILQTLASKKKYSKFKKIHFFVYEKMLDLYARDFLLFAIALEHPSRRGIQEKTELFLEIFGNLMIRDYTSQIIRNKANEFIKYITDLKKLSETELKIFNFELLKFKERDFLENIFKFWRLQNEVNGKDYFPAAKCWDIRLRSYFGIRFDSRSNAYDWDFSMKLTDRKNAGLIQKRIYSRWRETGQAFELRDSNYDTPNPTMASNIVFNDPRNGDKSIRRGYFGDILIGPYVCFGINSKNIEHYKKSNDMYKYSSVDVSKENVSSYFKSLIESTGIDLIEYQTDEEKLSKKLNETKIVEVTEEEIQEINDLDKTKTSKNLERDYISLDDCKITFLPLTIFEDFTKKSKYDKCFDIAYFSNSGISYMKTSINKILKPNALVFIETAKFIIEMKDEQINSFSDTLRNIAKENDLVEILNVENEAKTSQEETNKQESLDYLIFKYVQKP